MYLYMRIKSIMDILHIFKKKVVKLGTLGLTLIGLMISGSSSFAKYYNIEFGDIFHVNVTMPSVYKGV